MNAVADSPAGPHRPLWRASGSLALLALAACALLLALLRAHPQLDLAAAAPFFQAAPCVAPVNETANARICGTFPLETDATAQGWRMMAYRLIQSAGLASFMWLLYVALVPPANGAARAARLTRALLPPLALLAGPVLLVNVVLKAFWGRPRPYQTDLFGGTAPFALPGTVSDGCTSNCSFVSGEVSSAAWFIAFVPMVPRGWRIPFAAAVAVFTVTVSYGRIAFGRHYLSDAVMAAALTLAVIAAIGWILQRPAVQERLAAVRSSAR